MNIKTALAIASAAEQCGVDIELREGYHGRNRREPTTGLVVHSVIGFVGLMQAVSVAAIQSAKDNKEKEFVGDLANLASDGMGLGMIVY